MAEAAHTTIDQAEVDHFSRIAAEWWNPQGKFRPLHKFNPARIAYIKEKVCLAFDRNPKDELPLKGLRFLDIGCGGGLLCEPMARLGGDVVGADASKTNIEVAKIHATQSGLNIDYRATTAEVLADGGEKFDVVLNMEVVEHVANVDLFMSESAKMVKPQGLMFVATLNRTWKAWGLAIIGAEYILRWLPKGTHDYNKFLTPAEITAKLNEAGLTVIDELGITYNPLDDSWNRSKDMDVNYMLLARRLK
ncbi:bifunctional 2-polyprenyl-6-hydroxyphenol methylase/3-demethylubiquinol 3-O-methyltransferase UbiG [uncultured Bartonella sp.]|uniref:bifunctional 2-polyprenyl-6-hydroxyphenol methylase/3-demethylubiquinol 3-O-methyltransferase UbiG n=1 Tax=uncultured Bartonella sp. TaxID=104108 RepID=UPI00262A51BD|nr:bifunctional 2-polyprenyl-6-hydroxyphenol methylase/3-demethylubiquinol 3-O-methyltransferase UbiG [uncultured Bartonella sp.]